MLSNFKEAQFSTAYGILCAPATAGLARQALYPTFCRIPASGTTEPHAHFEPEIFFIVNGHGVMSIGGSETVVGRGDLIHIPPFENHALRNLSTQKELHFLSVYGEDFEVSHLPPRAIITAAPPTPNGPVHLGHISGPYIAADVLRRYLALRGASVRSHSGTDDNQNYVATGAKTRAIGTEEFRQSMRARIQAGFANTDIVFTEFIEPRTDEAYKDRVRAFTSRLAPVLEQREVAFPYCAPCDRYLADAGLSGHCPECDSPSAGGCESCGIVVPPWEVEQPHCSKCQSPSTTRLITVPVFPLSKHLEALESVEANLSPRVHKMIERVRNHGGLDVMVAHPPSVGEGFALGSNVLHVWTEMAAHYESFAHAEETWIHFFGFDNSFYYLLYIPALLKALNAQAKLPDHVVINEFLELDGAKFSTSRGHAIWADEFDGPRELLRLYLAYRRPSKQTDNFAVQDFERFAAETSAVFTKLRERTSKAQPVRDAQALVEANRFIREMELHYSPESFNLRQAARAILAFSDLILQGSPESDYLRLRALAQCVAPLMPELSRELGGSPEKWITDFSSVV